MIISRKRFVKLFIALGSHPHGDVSTERFQNYIINFYILNFLRTILDFVFRENRCYHIMIYHLQVKYDYVTTIDLLATITTI